MWVLRSPAVRGAFLPRPPSQHARLRFSAASCWAVGGPLQSVSLSETLCLRWAQLKLKSSHGVARRSMLPPCLLRPLAFEMASDS
eukprot:3476969-Pyramimonas_sp.AAC.1